MSSCDLRDNVLQDMTEVTGVLMMWKEGWEQVIRYWSDIDKHMSMLERRWINKWFTAQFTSVEFHFICLASAHSNIVTSQTSDVTQMKAESGAVMSLAHSSCQTRPAWGHVSSRSYTWSPVVLRLRSSAASCFHRRGALWLDGSELWPLVFVQVRRRS